ALTVALEGDDPRPAGARADEAERRICRGLLPLSHRAPLETDRGGVDAPPLRDRRADPGLERRRWRPRSLLRGGRRRGEEEREKGEDEPEPGRAPVQSVQDPGSGTQGEPRGVPCIPNPDS